MGCVSSRLEEPKLVVLCRERRDFIREAVDCRYALASSHAAYFLSLRSVGEALERFVKEDLDVVSSSATPGDSSPVLAIPSSQGKDRDSRSLSAAAGDFMEQREGEDGHLHFSSEEEEDERKDEDGGRRNPRSYHNKHMNYMKRSSGKPTTVYQNPYSSPYTGYRGHFGVPPSSSYNGNGGWYSAYNDNSYYPLVNHPRRSVSPPESPPPPPEGGSGWEFLDPFATYEQAYSRYRIGSFGSSTNSNEIREKEGIPDLEDETQQESLKEGKKAQVVIGTSDENCSTPQEGHMKDILENSSPDEKQGSDNPECIASTSSGECCGLNGVGEDKEELVKKREINFDVEKVLGNGKSEPGVETALSAAGSRDTREVVKVIRKQFIIASGCGEDLSALLEVGKKRHPARKTMFKVLPYSIMDYLPTMASRRSFIRSFKLPLISATRMSRTSHLRYKMSTSMKFGTLSSTLERLYVWEKKLYKEVKDEEKLRVTYDKKFKRLKILYSRGEESYKIEEIRASMKNIATKLDIAVKSIEAISTRIQKLRDEMLQAQLTELIWSWIKMWSSLLECHHMQYQAILNSKTRNLLAKTGTRKNSGSKASKELKKELLNWYVCFGDWIRDQKTFLGNLNEWLSRCLDVKPEVTLDGEMPFSPGRIGAPAVFIICNDWCQALKMISETDVRRNMLSFIESIHKLREIQDEEQHQERKVEHLSRDLARRLRSWYKESGIKLRLDSPDERVVLVSENGVPLEGHTLTFDSMRKRLEEEKDKHKEMLKRVHQTSSRILKAGLTPVFDALNGFSSQMLKAYDELRIPIPGGRS